MSDEGVNLSRRHFLTVATAVTGGAGIVAAAVPFVASMRPSAKAQALGAPVEIDTSKVEAGARVTVEWRGKPIFVVRRSQAALDRLAEIGPGLLRDPDSAQPQQPEFAQNIYRARRPEILVVVGVCTHLGCAPLFRPEAGAPDLGADWPGGFFCPCHGSKFDMSGRVFAGVPAPLNLQVPPYRFVTDSLVRIGDEGSNA